MANLAYVLINIQPGKEQEFANEIVTRGLIIDPKVEKLDFVHGSFDFIIILRGSRVDIDRRIIGMRKLPFVLNTVTLLPFEMLDWEDVEAAVKRQSK